MLSDFFCVDYRFNELVSYATVRSAMVEANMTILTKLLEDLA